MKIEVWSDFVCPFCYIGKRKLEKAISELPYKDEIEIIYKSYELDPRSPLVPTKVGYEAFAEAKGISLERAKDMHEPVIRMAREYGLTYHIDKTKRVRTLKAHRLAKWARTFNKEHALTELLMTGYFTKGDNINDDDTLLGYVSSLGLNQEKAREILTSDRYLDEVKYEIFEGKQVGVQGVPFFVFDDKYGISGAQPDEVFTKTLNVVYEEGKKKIIINKTTNDPGGVCGPDDLC